MEYPGLPEAVNAGMYLVPRMTRDELRSAINGPVAVGGGQIAPRLDLRLLNDVGDDQDQLPLLQHALMRAWDNCFWCLEMRGMPENASRDPAAPLPKNVRALGARVKVNGVNGVNVEVHGPQQVIVWLSPEWVDFEHPMLNVKNRNAMGESGLW